REIEHCASEPAGLASRGNPVAPVFTHRRREERLCVRILDREARGTAAQTEYARSHRKERRRSGEAEERARTAGSLPARYAGSFELRALRPSGSADPFHQSALCAGT